MLCWSHHWDTHVCRRHHLQSRLSWLVMFVWVWGLVPRLCTPRGLLLITLSMFLNTWITFGSWWSWRLKEDKRKGSRWSTKISRCQRGVMSYYIYMWIFLPPWWLSLIQIGLYWIKSSLFCFWQFTNLKRLQTFYKMYNQSGTVHEYYVNFMNISMNINSTNLETQEVDFLLKINQYSSDTALLVSSISDLFRHSWWCVRPRP